MVFQHLYAKKVKLTDLSSMQRRLNRHANTNHALEELTPMQLNRRVKERIAQLHLKRRPRSDAVGIEDFIVGTSLEFMQNAKIELREQYFLDALHFFQARY